MRLLQYSPDLHIEVPVSGGGSDVQKGALLFKGATPASHNGHLRGPATGTSAVPNIIGKLNELHDFSVSGDTDVAGTVFALREMEPAVPFRILRVEYDLTSLISATEAVSTATITLTSLEDNIDAAFLYVVSGVGAGQTNYLTASAGGSATLKAAFATDLDTTSRLVKILPRFHEIASLVTDGVKLANQAAAGAIEVIVLDNWIERNNHMDRLDPTLHDALTGLNNFTSLRFWADIMIRNTMPYSID